MKELINYLKNSLTAYGAVENAEYFLMKNGFTSLTESGQWNLKEGGKYYVVRNGSSIIAFVLGKGNRYKIVASHTDSPCLKLKENPALGGNEFTVLSTEPYGGGIYYSFFDRPLKIAGRAIYEEADGLRAENFVSPFNVVIPSVAVHMNRGVNEKFAPNPQTDLSPLLSIGKRDFAALIKNPLSYDLYAVCAEEPFESGAQSEFLSSPRVDNLTSVFSSLVSLAESNGDGVRIAACFDSEETGSRTRQGAGGDFLCNVLSRISLCRGLSEEEHLRAIASSFLVSLDNAHSLHPNHPELCDTANRAIMGGGVVIKAHAGGAYTTDAISSAIIKEIFKRAGVKYQTFYNRSDMRSGSTLGAISTGQVSIPSVDLGIAQLAMHSAVETFYKNDYLEAVKGLTAFYNASFKEEGNRIIFG